MHKFIAAVIVLSSLVVNSAVHAGSKQDQTLDKQEQRIERLIRWWSKIKRFGPDVEKRLLAYEEIGEAVGSLQVKGKKVLAATSLDLEVATTPFSLSTSNSGFGTEVNEPNPRGVMKRTVWRRFTVDELSRVVIETYGSEVDTAIAVYTGSQFGKLKSVAFNDDASIGGGVSTSSLVSFDAQPGIVYNVQLGSKTGAEGNVRMDIFPLPATGGITAFLVGGIPVGTFAGADWVCSLGSGGLSFCPAPVFIVHNATDRTVTISAKSPLGQGSVPPSPFTLKAGGTVLKSFTFSAGFDIITLRSLSGTFDFTAEAGGKVVGKTKMPAVLTVFGSNTSGVDLKLRTVPLSESSTIGGLGVFPVEIANVGTTKAMGCQFSQLFDASFNVSWYRYDATSGRILPKLNPIFDIEAGARLPFLVGLVSDTARLGDDNNTVRVQCTNADKFAQQIPDVYGFNMASLTSLRSHLMPVPTLRGDVVKVPRSGTVYKLEFINEGVAAAVELNAAIIAPVTDKSNSRFQASVCSPDMTDAQCLKSNASSISMQVPANKRFTVKVAVKRPTSDPGFDPELRRLVVGLRETLGFFGSVETGRHSIALQYR